MTVAKKTYNISLKSICRNLCLSSFYKNNDIVELSDTIELFSINKDESCTNIFLIFCLFIEPETLHLEYDNKEAYLTFINFCIIILSIVLYYILHQASSLLTTHIFIIYECVSINLCIFIISPKK
jgi:hypothetical protein